MSNLTENNYSTMEIINNELSDMQFSVIESYDTIWLMEQYHKRDGAMICSYPRVENVGKQTENVERILRNENIVLSAVESVLPKFKGDAVMKEGKRPGVGRDDQDKRTIGICGVRTSSIDDRAIIDCGDITCYSTEKNCGHTEMEEYEDDGLEVNSNNIVSMDRDRQQGRFVTGYTDTGVSNDGDRCVVSGFSSKSTRGDDTSPSNEYYYMENDKIDVKSPDQVELEMLKLSNNLTKPKNGGKYRLSNTINDSNGFSEESVHFEWEESDQIESLLENSIYILKSKMIKNLDQNIKSHLPENIMPALTGSTKLAPSKIRMSGNLNSSVNYEKEVEISIQEKDHLLTTLKSYNEQQTNTDLIVENYKNAISASEQKNVSLTKDIVILEILQSELSTIRKSNDNLRKSLHESNKSVEILKHNVHRIQARFDEAIEHNRKCSKAMSKHRQKYIDLSEKSKLVSDELEITKAKLASLTMLSVSDQIRDKQSMGALAEKLNLSFKEKTQNMETELNKVKRIKEIHEQENEKLREDLEKINEKYVDLESENKNIKRELELKKVNVSECNEKLMEKDRSLSSLKNENLILQNSLDTLTMELESAVACCLFLSNDSGKPEVLRNTIIEPEMYDENKKKEIEEIKGECQRAVDQAISREQEWKVKCGNLEMKLDGHVKEFEELTNKYEDVLEQDKQTENLKSELELKEKKLDMTFKELEEFKLQMVNIKNEYLERSTGLDHIINTQSAFVENLLEEKLILHNESNEKELIMENYKMSANDLSVIRDCLNVELFQTKQALLKMTQQVETSQQEIGLIKQKLDAAEEDANEYKIQMDLAKNSMLKKEWELEQIKKELTIAIEEKESAQKELVDLDTVLKVNQDLLDQKMIEIEKANKTTDQYEENFFAVSVELNQLKFQYSLMKKNSNSNQALKLEFKNRTQQLVRCEQELETMTNEFNILKKEHEILHQKAKVATHNLQTENGKYNKKIAELLANNERLEKFLLDSKLYVTEALSPFNTPKDGFSALRTELQLRDLEIEKQNDKLKNYDSLIFHYNELKERYKDKRKQLEINNSKIKMLESNVFEYAESPSKNQYQRILGGNLSG